MVRKRTPKTLEEFASEADSSPAISSSIKDETKLQQTSSVDKSHKTELKHMGISFTEEEHARLKKAAKESGRSMKGFIRHAVKLLAREVLGD